MNNEDMETPMSDCQDYDVTGEIQAAILSQALPFMQHYAGKAIVIKYGGHAMGDKKLSRAFCRDIALVKQSGAHPVIVHGGGPQIARILDQTGIKSRFIGGLRITDKQTMEVVEMVLAGSINKSIVASMNAQGARAIGLCGKDGNMALARKASRGEPCPDSNIEKALDLGFVGEPEKIDRTVLDMLIHSGLIPVIAPVSPGKDGNTYNVNADVFAGAIAQALGATKLLFLTDVPGALDKNGALIEKMSIDEAKALIRDGVVSGGMIPKVSTCIEALEKGVGGVVILDGKRPHAVLLELFTKHGAGTLIVK